MKKYIVLFILKNKKIEHFKPNFKNLVPGVFEIWHTLFKYVIKIVLLPLNEWFYYMNRVYRISNTPGTKSLKFGLKCSILHFKMDKTIKFERTFFFQFFSLKTFLESVQDIHVNYCHIYIFLM